MAEHATLYFEDLAVGRVFPLGTVRAELDEMLEYARRYDMQPMHTDPVAAKHTVAGGLIASGWLTTSWAMRLISAAKPYGDNPVLGIGVDALRWPVPVRPGDVLTGAAEIIELRPSASKPDRGWARLRITLTNATGGIALSMEPTMVLPRRKKGSGA